MAWLAARPHLFFQRCLKHQRLHGHAGSSSADAGFQILTLLPREAMSAALEEALGAAQQC